MLNTLVKPNDIIECEPGNILVSHHSQKCVKNNSQPSAVHDHILFCTTVVCPEDFSILAKSSCNFKLESQESILIKLLKPTLNLINFLFISLIRSIEMLCKRISLSCVKVYWTL